MKPSNFPVTFLRESWPPRSSQTYLIRSTASRRVLPHTQQERMLQAERNANRPSWLPPLRLLSLGYAFGPTHFYTAVHSLTRLGVKADGFPLNLWVSISENFCVTQSYGYVKRLCFSLASLQFSWGSYNIIHSSV